MNTPLQQVAHRVRTRSWPPSDRQIVAVGVLLAIIMWLTSSAPVTVSSSQPTSNLLGIDVHSASDELPETWPNELDAARRRAVELDAALAVELLKAEVAAMTDVEIWAQTELDLSRSE